MATGDFGIPICVVVNLLRLSNSYFKKKLFLKLQLKRKHGLLFLKLPGICIMASFLEKILG